MKVPLAPIASLVCEAKPGFASGDDLQEGVFQIRMNNITRDGGFDLTRKRRVRLDAQKAEGLLVKVGDVLFNATNSPDLVGKSAYVGSVSEPTTFSNHFIRIRTNQQKLDGSYLARWLHTQFQSGRFKGLCRQWVNQATVSREALLGLEIPLLPISEQRRISAILDKADTLRAKRRAALVEVNNLYPSIFGHMFGEAESIFGRWPTTQLGSKLDFLTSGSRGWAKYYAESGATFLRIQNVGRDELSLSDVAYVSAPNSAEARRTEVREGDVLLSITADLGRTAVVPADMGKAYINQHLSILRTKAFVPRYLSAFLASPAGQREVLGRNKQGVKAGLNFDDIRSFRIPTPPTDLQRKFASHLEEVERQKKVQQRSLTESSALFSSLQYRAFRGEL